MNQDQHIGSKAPPAAAVTMLLAAVGYAAGVVAQKPALRHAPALHVTTFGCLVGTIACLPVRGPVGQRRRCRAVAHAHRFQIT